MQYKKQEDFVVANETITIREFVVKCLRFMDFKFKFTGKGLKEKIVDNKNQVIVDVDKKFLDQ